MGEDLRTPAMTIDERMDKSDGEDHHVADARAVTNRLCALIDGELAKLPADGRAIAASVLLDELRARSAPIRLRMDWKAELDFELADAQEIVWRMRTAVLRSDGFTPEIAALADRLKYRAGVISGYVARLELLAQEAAAHEPVQAVAPPGSHGEIENAELYWSPEQLAFGRRFRSRVAQAREQNLARRQSSNEPA